MPIAELFGGIKNICSRIFSAHFEVLWGPSVSAANDTRLSNVLSLKISGTHIGRASAFLRRSVVLQSNNVPHFGNMPSANGVRVCVCSSSCAPWVYNTDTAGIVCDFGFIYEMCACLCSRYCEFLFVFLRCALVHLCVYLCVLRVCMCVASGSSEEVRGFQGAYG